MYFCNSVSLLLVNIYYMKQKILFFLFLSIGLEVAAQSHRSTVVVRGDNATSSVAQAYADSLQSLRDSLFKPKKQKLTSLKVADENHMRLLFPLTFYRDVTQQLFSNANAERDFNANLMHLYLTRPDLVSTTERAVQQQQTTINDIEKPIQHEAEMVSRVKEPPVEPIEVPVEVLVRKPNFWTYKGDYALQFLQNYVSGNWYRGGESNYAARGLVVMQANYNNKQKVKWDNCLELRYGLQSSRSDSLHSFKSTEDLIRLTSKLGLQATKRWYYTLQFIGQTQFSRAYKSNDPTVYADFLAPFTLNLSLGMDYSVDWFEHRLKGNVHLAPLAYNMKYTRFRSLSKRLGIGNDNHFLHDFGSEFTVDLEWKIMDMLSWKTRLYGYTTYKRAELEWENTLTLRFNRFISSQLFIYPRFDDGVSRDSHYAFWQLKEFASVGFQYSF